MPRKTSSARLDNAKVSHSPLGRVAAYKHHSITRFHTFTGKESSNTGCEFVKIFVGGLFFVAIALDAHCNASRVAFGRSLEQFQKVAIGVDALWFRTHLVFECGKDPLRKTRK